MLLLMGRLKKELFLDFMGKMFLKLSKILLLYALVITEMLKKLVNHYHIYIQYSIELYLVLWPKEEISKILMALVANQSMDLNSLMKALKFIIKNLIFFPQPMQVQIQMDHNFSLLSKRLHG
jgi:hypothetical protein